MRLGATLLVGLSTGYCLWASRYDGGQLMKKILGMSGASEARNLCPTYGKQRLGLFGAEAVQDLQSAMSTGPLKLETQ